MGEEIFLRYTGGITDHKGKGKSFNNFYLSLFLFNVYELYTLYTVFMNI